MSKPLEGVVLETLHLTWEEIQDEQAWEEFLAQSIDPGRQARAVVVLSFCVNQLGGVTDLERALLREMLNAVTTNTTAVWGAQNRHRMDEVRVVFDRMKELINASQP